MINCSVCNESLRGKTRIKEHHERFHKEPILNKDGTITINACHQVELIIKGDETWEQRKKAQKKNDRRFKRKDDSAWLAIEQLENFEKEHDIQFGYTKEGEFYTH